MLLILTGCTDCGRNEYEVLPCRVDRDRLCLRKLKRFSPVGLTRLACLHRYNAKVADTCMHTCVDTIL